MKLSLKPFVTAVKSYWQQHPSLTWMAAGLWLLLIGGVAFFQNLGTTGLMDETEPLFAEAARQMIVRGDWLTPYFNGEPRFDKPPLVYWLMAIAYQTIGVNEWSVRLPSALAGFALTCFGFYTLRRFGFSYGSEPDGALQQNRLWLAAYIGSALIALNPQTIGWSRIGVSDMLLSGCLGSALLAFFIAYAQPSQPTAQKHWYLICYVLLAFGVLTKGPVAIVLAGLIIGGFLLYLGKLREVLREMPLVWGCVILLTIALPWFLAVTWANGEAFIESFFGYHNLERFTSVVNRHWAPWYFYFVVVLLGFAPWSFYLPLAIAQVKVWQRRQWQRQPRSHHLGLFALFWLVGVFGFFTIATTKLPSYVLPLMPAAGILVGLLFSDWIVQPVYATAVPARPHWGIKLSAGLNLLFWLLIAGAILSVPRWLKPDPAMPTLSQSLQQSGLLLLGGAIALLAAGFGLLLLLQRQIRWLWMANLIGFVALVMVVVTPVLLLLDSERQLPLRQLAAQVVQTRQPREDLIMIGFKKPSLVFYTQQPVTFVLKPERVARLVQSRNQPDPATLLLLAYPRTLTKVGVSPDQLQDLGRADPYQLVRVSKQDLLNSLTAQ